MIKFYNPLGKVCMTSDYFAGLVGAAAQSCYGVCGMATGGTSDSLKTIVLGTNYPDKGVRVTEEDGKLVIELHIKVTYGLNIAAIDLSLRHDGNTDHPDGCKHLAGPRLPCGCWQCDTKPVRCWACLFGSGAGGHAL